MTINKVVIILGIAAFSFGSCSSDNSAIKIEAKSLSLDEFELREMPPFKLIYLDGAPFDSKSLEGKVLFIDFWATWCGPCLHEIPSMIEMGKKYKEYGFEVVGITVQSGDAEDIQPTIDRLNMDYHVLIGDEETMNAFGGIYGFPTNFLITKKGNIYRKFLGVYPNKTEVVEKDIRFLLGLDEKPIEELNENI